MEGLIARDVRGMIEDMLEERAQGKEADRGAVEEVLTELGEPERLAARYREKKRYLIFGQWTKKLVLYMQAVNGITQLHE